MNKPFDPWKNFIQGELKTGSKLGQIFEKASFDSFDKQILTLVFEDEALAKKAKGQIEPLKKKLPRELSPCQQIIINTGKVIAPVVSQLPTKSKGVGNALQSLNLAQFGEDRQGNELPKPVLDVAVSAEKKCADLYGKLQKRTESLAGPNGEIFTVNFNWRVRVGGTRGFRELLLPVFHPVFGIPYIPASSLKGAARAWAAKNHEPDLNNLLGFLDGKNAAASKVEILDAFPTQPCLSVDVATPQWQWQGNKVRYKPEPHPLLGMEQPTLLIGLRPTERGGREDVVKVKEWLENALKVGIGSRVSCGYGKALGQMAYFSHSQSWDFEFWTQGMYGADNTQVEFRPTALRGILRYWFRAVALGLYSPTEAQSLEDEIFGQLSLSGKVAISAVVNPSQKKEPYLYNGKIYLEAQDKKYLNLLEKLLILASHLGGFGRGARRPLHLLNGRMRGCHWVIDGDNLPIGYDLAQWQNFLSNLKETFKAVKSSTQDYTSDPGEPAPRFQDVLDSNAQIWLLKSPQQTAPAQVNNWQSQGRDARVRGAALNLLYSDNKFKGESGKNRDKVGNQNVGGKLGTPSYVWIKSIFPDSDPSYQVVTIFGADHPDRQAFAKALKQEGGLLVWGNERLGASAPSAPKMTGKPQSKPIPKPKPKPKKLN